MAHTHRPMKNASSLLRHLLLLIFLSSPAAGEPTNKKNHFVLVHGSCHGAWSWYKLSTILQSWGDDVTALDMAASGVDPRQPKTISSAVDGVLRRAGSCRCFGGIPRKDLCWCLCRCLHGWSQSQCFHRSCRGKFLERVC